MGRVLLPVLASAVLLAGPAQAADAPFNGPPGASSCTGRKAADIVTFMREYKSGAWPSSVMGRIAKGFDDQQTDAIATWFAAQPE